MGRLIKTKVGFYSSPSQTTLKVPIRTDSRQEQPDYRTEKEIQLDNLNSFQNKGSGKPPSFCS